MIFNYGCFFCLGYFFIKTFHFVKKHPLFTRVFYQCNDRILCKMM